MARGIPGSNYGLARSAYLGKPGVDLADDLGVNVTDDVLFVVFSEPDQLMGDQPGDFSHSALCIYSLKSIQTMFTSNIQRCFGGEGNTGVEFIRPSHQCIKTKHNPINEEFCGLDINIKHLERMFFNLEVLSRMGHQLSPEFLIALDCFVDLEQ